MRRLAEVGNHEGLAMSDTIRLVLKRGLGGDEESQDEGDGHERHGPPVHIYFVLDEDPMAGPRRWPDGFATLQLQPRPRRIGVAWM